MKKALAITIMLLMLIPIGMPRVNSAPSEVSIEDVVSNSAVFNGRYVTLQGLLVAEQPVGKPSRYYLRDNLDNMVRLQFSRDIDLSGCEGKRIDAAGVFQVQGNEILVETVEVTPEEEVIPAPESLGVSGELKTIVIMAYFTDRAPTKSVGDVCRIVFNDMNSYWMEMSYDLVMVTGGWDVWRRLDHTVKYYGDDNPSWYFIRDAVAKADAAVDFSQYNYFVFINAGPNEETSGNPYDIWSAQWSGLSIPTNDMLGLFTITHGAISPDIEAGAAGALGVLCHEYGHELGLPDLYGYAGGVDGWDLMAEGTWNDLGHTPAGLTSFTRRLLGWGTQRHLSYGEAKLLTLDPIEDPTANFHYVRMWAGSGSDYYYVEARRQVGFDEHVPGEKVLVLFWDDSAKKLYLRATLDVGQVFRVTDVEVQVIREDLEGWAYRVYISHKTWSSNMRLTKNAASSYTAAGGVNVASVGSYVYAVWTDYRDDNWEIYFKRSKDNGVTWGYDTRLTVNDANSVDPYLVAFGSYVYVVWVDNRDGNNEIYFRRNEHYGDGGRWYGAMRLTKDAGNSIQPAVAAYGSKVYVVWQDDRAPHTAKYQIYFKRSTDNGLTWSADVRIWSPATSEHPAIAAYRNYVHVVWEDKRVGNYDIYHKRSTDYGATWKWVKQLTKDEANQRYASVAAYGNDVYVVWTDYRHWDATENTEIYYRRSFKRGEWFSKEERLTNAAGGSYYPVVAVKGKTVYIVWQDERTDQWEVFFADSPNRGRHWTADRILSAQPVYSAMPSISVASDNVYVVWTDLRDMNYEIYFTYRH